MSQVIKCSADDKSASEVQVILSFPVLDCTKEPALDSTARISVDVEYSAKKSAKATCPNMKCELFFKPTVIIDQNIN